MAAVVLTVATAARTGIRVNDGVAPDATDGVTFANDGKVFLEVANANAAARTVTLVTSETISGLAIENPTVVVPAGHTYLIGPFKPSLFGRTTQATFSAITDVTCKAVSFTADPN